MKLIAFLLLSLSTICLYAAPPNRSFNFSPGVGTPITTTTAETMDKGSWGLSFRSEFARNRPIDPALLLADLSVESQDSISTSFAMLNYGLDENLTIGLSLPYVYISQIEGTDFNGHDLTTHLLTRGSPTGLGDTSLYSMWHFFENKKNHVDMAFLVGLNAPTGKTTERDSTGLLFASSNQPGSGAWTPFGGWIITKTWHTLSLSGNLIYTQGTEGAQRTTLGSLFDWNFAAVYELYEGTKLDVDGVLELNGEYADVNIIEGLTEPNSGGTFLFLSPGFRADVGDYTSVYLALSVPLLENYFGLQVKTQYAVYAGVDFSLD